MTERRLALIAPFVLLLAGCGATTGSVCDGWRNLTPASGTRSYIIANDRPFAEQVAAHRDFGRAQGCWK